MAVFGMLSPQDSPGDEEEAGPTRVPFLVGRDEEGGLLRPAARALDNVLSICDTPYTAVTVYHGCEATPHAIG